MPPLALFFAVTLFVSAFLLFLVQPMVGKMVLPLLGGAPAAWATCMVFFQALLLAGYSYAHATARRLGSRRQAVLHLAVLAVPLIALGVTALRTGAPIHAYKSLAPQGQQMPFVGAIALLAAAIGLPFFVVSASAPLLQHWFADTQHPGARDPYFLYAASNLGSLLALVAYPFLVEPRFRLAEQGWLWSAGYLLLVGLTIGCAWKLRRTGPASEPPARARVLEHKTLASAADSRSRALRWMALAFVPSSLLLSVTQFITTDIAPVPGLWVLPLAIYLLTFIVAFGRTPRPIRRFVQLAAPVAVLLLLFSIMAERKPASLGLILTMHLVVFLLVALNCHIDLADRRPGAARLTEFYLWVSLGGVLGGLFNSLVAPLLFNELLEYPLVLVASCFLLPVTTPGGAGLRTADIAVGLGVAGLALALFFFPVERWLPLVISLPVFTPSRPYYRWANLLSYALWRYIAFGMPLLVSYWWVERPARFGACVAAVWLALFAGGEIDQRKNHQLLRRDRSFFGVLTVQNDVDRTGDGDAESLPDGTTPDFHRLVHGTTLHGLQQWDPPSDEPMTYYHRSGPIGQVFAADLPAVRRGKFAFVGLGSGSLAAYGRPGQSITFYEIDPAVIRIASEPRYFTYLSDCKAKVNIVVGDARLNLEDRASRGEYSLIVVDAFSSDAIPIHLLTKEAVQLYFDKLADDGILALHLSNRYLDLPRVVSALVRDLRNEQPNLAALCQADHVDRFDPQADDPAGHPIPGKRSSLWAILARDQTHLAGVSKLPPTMTIDGRTVTLSIWKDFDEIEPGPLWTDDFSNLTQILNWDQIRPW